MSTARVWLARLAVPLLAAGVVVSTLLVPARQRVGEARYERLVQVDAERLVRRPDGTASRVTALSLFDESGGELLFARVRGRWRCLSHFMAPADGARIGELVNTIASAEPLVATVARDQAQWLAAFDLGAGRARRMVLRGPDALKPESSGDVLADIWIGSAGAVRRATGGEPRDELLLLAQSLDGWFIAPVTLDENRLPPLVMAQIVPPDWLGNAEGVVRVFVDRADGTGFEVQRAEDPDLPTGIFAWDLRESSDTPWRRAHPLLSTGFTLFLARATCVCAVDPRSVPASVSERPDVAITLVSAANTILELRVGPKQLDGTRFVINMDTQTAFLVAARPAELLTPPTDWLEKPGASIPWDPYLR